MKMNEHCLPCLVNQVIKVADITNAKDRNTLYQKVFYYLSQTDFNKTNPELIGKTFSLLKKHIKNEDPYKEIRAYYNELFLNMVPKFKEQINKAKDPFQEAVKYAIVGNIIDFNPIHNTTMEDILNKFKQMDELELTINHVNKLKELIKTQKTLLYLGDNCGEICLDLIMLEKIKDINPDIEITFGVRGEPVVNDSIEEDAYQVGIDQFATILSNGDRSLGTVLPRTSKEFQNVYASSDIVIAKGQANFESLSEEKKENIFYLLMTKCQVIANLIGIKEKSLVCMNQELIKN